MAEDQHAELAEPEKSYDTDAIFTIPNILSFLRLIGVPVFLVLILMHHDVGAIVLLAIASLTDWLDGKLARGLHLVSRLGQVLDPIADRLYIIATVIGLAVRGILPWWLLVVLLARDVMLLCLVPFLRTRGYTSLPVHYVGKAATFCLLYALPLVLLGAGPWGFSPIARIIGWAFAIWGTFLYWYAGLLYVRQGRMLLRASRPAVLPTDRY